MDRWSTIETRYEYNLALERIEELSVNLPSPKSVEDEELMLLGFLVSEYEEINFLIQSPE